MAGAGRVLTAGPSFQAAAAGAGPWGPGAERGAPAAPVLHVAAQGGQRPHHRGLCAGGDLPGQPPAGAEGRGGESCPHRARLCPWVPAVPKSPGSPWLLPWLGEHWRLHTSPVLRAPRGPLSPCPPAQTPETPAAAGYRSRSWPAAAGLGTARHRTAPHGTVPGQGLLCCCAEQPLSCPTAPAAPTVPTAPAAPAAPAPGRVGVEGFPRRSESPPRPPALPHQPLMRLSPRKQTASLPCRHVIISLSK